MILASHAPHKSVLIKRYKRSKIYYRRLSRYNRRLRKNDRLSYVGREIPVKTKVAVIEFRNEQDIVSYDKDLQERSFTQWQFGDWKSLARLNRDIIQHHPERDKLALLGAAGRFQVGCVDEAKKFIHLAQDWGINRKLISLILIAGVHNSLGRAAVIGNQRQSALQHFKNAIIVGSPRSDIKLLTQARTSEQMVQIGYQDTHARNLAHATTSISNFITSTLADKVRLCMESKDIPEEIDRLVDSKTVLNNDLIFFYMEVSRQFAKRNDKVMELQYMQIARDLLSQHDE